MYFNAFILALRSIRRNMMRSFLTVLGIVIGVASVIAMVFLGDSTTKYVSDSISKLGSNMLILAPGQESKGPRIADSSAAMFDAADVEAIKREISGLKAVAPTASKGLNAVYGNENYSTTVYGTDNDYFIAKEWSVESGRIFSPTEIKSGKAVCIIGNTVKEELFGNRSLIGEKLRLEKFSCQIIGLLESKGSSGMGMDQDDLVLVPLKMFQRRISGSHDIPSIQISADDGVSTVVVKKELIALFRERRHIREGTSDDFNVHDMKEVIDTLSTTTTMLTILLGAVAAISLLVGGIGIMNIMLVSVTERTREIGIRLAIGALEHEVLLQFLIESVVLASIGGIIGIIVGISIAVAVTIGFDLPFVFNQNIIAIAFLFSTLVGVLFGYFPARKAAMLNPIDALRHE